MYSKMKRLRPIQIVLDRLKILYEAKEINNKFFENFYIFFISFSMS